MDKQAIYLITTFFLAGIALECEIEKQEIHSWVTTLILIIGVVLHIITDGWQSLASMSIAYAVTASIFTVFYYLGGPTANDIRFAAALSAVAGLTNVGYLLIYTSVSGAALALIYIFAYGKLKQTMKGVVDAANSSRRSHLTRARSVSSPAGILHHPYGVAFVFGSLLSLIQCAVVR